MKLLRTLRFSAVTFLLAVGACSMGVQEAGEASPQAPGNDAAIPPVFNSGAGGGTFDDSGIEVGSKGSGIADPYAHFASLCGDGCKPGGDAAECNREGSSGAGGSIDPSLSCRLVPKDGVVSAQCLPAGAFTAGGPCQTSADCAAGLGCEATLPQGGVCRQYCCGNVEACVSGTFCDARPMAESVGEGADALAIPVCVPAVNCELLNDRACPAGLTCTIVRGDGTTSCIVPGVSEAREECPCAPGFVCSMLTNECKKLCHVIDNGLQECGVSGSCQGGSMGYPAGFGVCVGGNY